jgi:hypothetical protein
VLQRPTETAPFIKTWQIALVGLECYLDFAFSLV